MTQLIQDVTVFIEMNQKSTAGSEKLTILVFKDSFAARTFQIPLRWISQFSLIMGAMVTVTLVCGLFAVKTYFLARKADPSRIQELEQEVGDLKTSLRLAEAPKLPKGTATTATNGPTSTVPTSTVPTSTVSASTLFSAFPLGLSGTLPPPSTLHFTIENPQTSWSQNTLIVHFSLHYRSLNGASDESQDSQATPQGTQHGRIIILARGPETMFVYPSGVLGRAGAQTLLSPEDGESFSVSRFREVKADFGPVASKDAIQDVEIFIFDKEGKDLLAYQKLPLKEGE